MDAANCPAGRISGAYPGGCTEFGGGIENLYASSQGLGAYSTTNALLDAIFGWNYKDAGSAWGHCVANLDQTYDDDYGEANQEGLVGFGIAQSNDPNVTWKTVVVVNYTNPVPTPNNCNYNITVSTNSISGGGGGNCGITAMNAGTPVCSGDGASYTVTINWTGNDASVTINGGTGATPATASGGTSTSVTFTYPSTQAAESVTVTDTDTECTYGPFNFTKPANCPPVSPDCSVNNLTVTAAHTGNQIAITTINTSGTINTTGTITYQASNSITLNPGFTGNPGFDAKIAACTSATNGTCASPHVLTCGTNYSGNTTGGENNWTNYNNSGTAGWTGPEKVHTLVVPANSTRVLNLTGNTSDVDLFVGTACSNTVQFSSDNIGDNVGDSVNIVNNTGSAVTYYVIVDGWNGVSSPYTLSCAAPLAEYPVVTGRNISDKENQGLIHEELLMDLVGIPSLSITPNPIQHFATFHIQVTAESPVDLQIFNVSGKRVGWVLKNHWLTKGMHTISYDATMIESGLYFVHLKAGTHTLTRKMSVVARK